MKKQLNIFKTNLEMKYLYYFIWVGIATFYKYFSGFLFRLRKFIWKVGNTSKEEQRRWIKDYNSGFFSFPRGITDWFAYGVFSGIFLVPIIVFTLKFKIDIYTNNNKWYFIGISVFIGVFCYYWIYFRNIDWLKKRINKINKKYYLKSHVSKTF